MSVESPEHRLLFLDNLRTFLIFLVVLVHAGVVYESSGIMGPYWIVDDPTTSDLPGLVNLILDLFVMPTIFFISGCFAPQSLNRHGSWGFIKSKLRRLMIPWAVATLTLMPLYKVIFLYSRGLPQESWTTYLHFSNGELGMSWLWFLPVLFAFDCLYLAAARLGLRFQKLSIKVAAVATLLLGFAYTLIVSSLGWLGWTKTPLADFQNERLLPYLLIFLLGSMCSHKAVLDKTGQSKRLYIAVSATVWIPVNVYIVLLLNYFLRPGQPIVSEAADELVLWLGLHLSMLGLVYCMVMTFKYFFNHQGAVSRALSRLSYSVYIIHMLVLGPIALLLLNVEIPAVAKCALLTLTTYLASNLLAHAAILIKRAWSKETPGISRLPELKGSP